MINFNILYFVGVGKEVSWKSGLRAYLLTKRTNDVFISLLDGIKLERAGYQRQGGKAI